MSSNRRRPRHSHRSHSNSNVNSFASEYPSAWSDWAFDVNQNRYQRYRLTGLGVYEYDYNPPQTASSSESRPRIPGPFGGFGVPAANGHYPEFNAYTTAPLNPMGTRLTPINSNTTPSYFNPVAQVVQNPPPVWQSTRVTTRDPSTKREEFDPHYKVQKPAVFKTGKIFKVLWSEPKGNGGGGMGNNSEDTVTIRSGRNGDVHEKVRRFLIINPMEGHCICLPIMTYGGQGVNKNGVHAEHHTIIHSTEHPEYLPGEESKLTKMPLLVEPASPRHKLDPASRLNYAKTYTVEYNVKVWFIGKLVDDSYWQMTADYNIVHPPLPTKPSMTASHLQTRQDTSMFAMGGDDGGYAAQQHPSYGMSRGSYSPSQYTGQQPYAQFNGGLAQSQWASDQGTSSRPVSASFQTPSSYAILGSRSMQPNGDLGPLPEEASSLGYTPTAAAVEQDDLELPEEELESAAADLSEEVPSLEGLSLEDNTAEDVESAEDNYYEVVCDEVVEEEPIEQEPSEEDYNYGESYSVQVAESEQNLAGYYGEVLEEDIEGEPAEEEPVEEEFPEDYDFPYQEEETVYEPQDDEDHSASEEE